MKLVETIHQGNFFNRNVVEFDGEVTVEHMRTLMAASPYNYRVADRPDRLLELVSDLQTGKPTGHGWAHVSIED